MSHSESSPVALAGATSHPQNRPGPLTRSRTAAAWCAAWFVLAFSPFAAAQVSEEAPERENNRAAMFERIQKLVGSFRSFGNWDDQYGMMMDSMERVYERQGWNTESDRFSLDLVRTVEAIPPWSVQERFDTTVRTLSDRYLLDEQQERSLRARLMRLSTETFSRHSGRIMEYAVDAIQTRASGQPFTPEMVQKWATLAEPVFLDVRGRMQVAAREFAQELDPEQRAILDEDMGSVQKRLSKVAEMGESWKRGEWSPEQWGMEDDPIQNGTYAGAVNPDAGLPADGKKNTINPRTVEAAPAPAEDQPQPGADGEPIAEGQPPAPDQTAAPQPTDFRPPPQFVNDPWSRFVEAFIAKYSLNNDQAARAWQIFATVRTRRDEMQTKFDQRVAAPAADAQSPAAEKQRAQHTSAVQRLFEQLSRRLDQLPTRAQRAAAKPGDLPNPVGPPAAPSHATPRNPPAAKPENPAPTPAAPK